MPVLLLGRTGPSPRNRSNDLSWLPLREHFKGRKWEVNLKNSEHMTFCDMPPLPMVCGMEGAMVDTKMVGTLDGETAYVKAFLGVVLRRQESALLQGPRVEFPEVVFG